jgi:hypothetical protein
MTLVTHRSAIPAIGCGPRTIQKALAPRSVGRLGRGWLRPGSRLLGRPPRPQISGRATSSAGGSRLAFPLLARPLRLPSGPGLGAAIENPLSNGPPRLSGGSRSEPSTGAGGKLPEDYRFLPIGLWEEVLVVLPPKMGGSARGLWEEVLVDNWRNPQSYPLTATSLGFTTGML